MRKTFYIISIFLYLCGLAVSQPEKPVYVIPVKGIIDLGLASFIKRSLLEAKEKQSLTVILEIDTLGGRLDAAMEIADALEEIKPIPTVAFIDDQAWSAGALIALACEKIIMSAGSTIGSAEPRLLGMGSSELIDEKTISAVRAKFKALAEENKHPLNLALAMVDKEFEIKQVKIKEETRLLSALELEELKSQYKDKEIQVIKTVNPKGKLLNLTANEAKEFGLAEAILNSRAEVIRHLGGAQDKAVSTKITWSEGLVRFLTHPLVSPLLLTLGFLGLLFELKIPGWGLSGTFGLVCLALFFWGHYLVGLANWTEIIMFFAGIILLLLEILVIPGFGLTGISGIALILSGIFFSLIKHPFTDSSIQLRNAFYTLSFAIIATFGFIVLAWKFLPKTSLYKRFILDFSETKKTGFRSSASLESYLGKTGKTVSALRPSGKAVIAGSFLDVITEGKFIDKDKEIKVVRIEGNKITVEEV